MGECEHDMTQVFILVLFTRYQKDLFDKSSILSKKKKKKKQKNLFKKTKKKKKKKKKCIQDFPLP